MYQIYWKTLQNIAQFNTKINVKFSIQNQQLSEKQQKKYLFKSIVILIYIQITF